MSKGPPTKLKIAKQQATPEPDFEGDKAAPDESKLLIIVKHAERIQLLDKMILEQSLDLKELTDEKFNLEMAVLPELMTQLGIDKYKTTSGILVQMDPFVQASLPAAGAIDKATGEEKVALEEKLQAGLQYLRDHDAESLIKSQVIIAFGKGEESQKQALVTQLEAEGHKTLAVETVHPQTLVSYIKEQLAAGIDVPFETFNIYSGKKAKVKMPKKG